MPALVVRTRQQPVDPIHGSLDKAVAFAYKTAEPTLPAAALAGGSRLVRDRGKGSWRRAVLVLVVTAGSLAARALAAPAPDPKAKALNPAQVMQALDGIGESQRTLAAALSQLREQLSDLQGSVSQLRDELRQSQDTEQNSFEQLKGMREDVRGLYVESSGEKSDIAQVGKQVENLDQSLGGFRLSSGVVVAVVIVLQVVLVGLMLRGRG